MGVVKDPIKGLRSSYLKNSKQKKKTVNENW